jgi:hypothetical protein
MKASIPKEGVKDAHIGYADVGKKIYALKNILFQDSWKPLKII